MNRPKRGAVTNESARRPFRRRGRHHPALAAVINTIVDALSEFGVRNVEMPATPERVWRALRAGG